jgi:hypothetical protein
MIPLKGMLLGHSGPMNSRREKCMDGTKRNERNSELRRCIVAIDAWCRGSDSAIGAVAPDRPTASCCEKDGPRPKAALRRPTSVGFRFSTALIGTWFATAPVFPFAAAPVPPAPCVPAVSIASSSVTFSPDPIRKHWFVASILVRNDGTTQLQKGAASIYLFDVNGKSLGSPPQQNLKLTALPGEVQSVQLSLDVPDETLPVSGYVVIGASADKCDGGAKQPIQTFVIPAQSSPSNSRYIVLISAAAAALVFLIAILAFRKSVGDPMGVSEWSFSGSAVTNLTVAGALLTGLLASAAFPDYPHYLTKQGYLVLGLLFGVLASLAPVLYDFQCEPTGIDPTNPKQLDFQGSVWSFLVSAAITVWAVFGQLATLSIMFQEFAMRKLISHSSALSELVVATCAGASLLDYCYRCAKYYIEDHPSRSPSTQTELGAEEAPLLTGQAGPRWTAF